ncbi:hypothetical protein DU500_09220 [Haloplanus rubicundus]|uniref:LamG-like jellyroll fold domain-containing protein n=1 Tax=Haloplanus rubicundus TaxID=1547898 RepID=A0A345E321_9EURY|nr:LamG domain-containing protein [Haloplanus rubicundus]AXG06593.1 hypothetical protein DU500_09220 [Haloplanus rubicundus]
MTDDFELTRRKALAALGTIGVASAGAGLGTSAYFSDQETFQNNQLTAGELDMKVSWAEHYSDWSADEAEFARMEDGELVVDDREGFMNATLEEQFPDDETRQAIETGDADPCEVLADVPDDLDGPVINIEDVKPGDFGEVTFDFALCDNPGYVWLNGSLRDASENGLTEPEADDPDEQDGVVELLDEIRVTVWYDDGDNVLEDPETIVTDREFEPNPISASIAVSGDDRIVTQGTLREVLTQLSIGNGIPLDANPTSDGRDCYTNSPTIHYIGFLWELPVDHANEIQSDSATFDLGFYTEQCRHNDGVGLATDLEAYYPLDGTANVGDVSGNGYDATTVGDVSYASGKVGQAASFDGDGDYVDLGPNFQFDDTQPFSVVGWFNRDGVSGFNDRLLGFDTVNSWGLLFDGGYIDGGQDLVFRYGGTNLASGVGAAFGDWTHFAVTHDGNGGLSLYIDGTEAASATGASWSSPSQSFILGNTKRWVDRDDEWFDGRIDDVRIYSRALSASEVQSLYDSA